MFDLLPTNASDRKLRLFGVACCRHVESHLWAGVHSLQAISVAEEYADGLATEEQLGIAQLAVESRLELYPAEPVYDASYWACGSIMGDCAWRCGYYAANCSTRPFAGQGSEADAQCKVVRANVLRVEAMFLRDIFGNPFRPVAFSPAWRTDTAVALANQTYDSRDFGAMPILADALQDAGCDSEEVLGHCRGPGPHVRGCWVVDLVLDRK
jgi:hypothetical protein